MPLDRFVMGIFKYLKAARLQRVSTPGPSAFGGASAAGWRDGIGRYGCAKSCTNSWIHLLTQSFALARFD